MDAYQANLRALMELMVPMLSPALRTVGMMVPSPDLKIAPHWATSRVLRPGGKDWNDGDYGDLSGHGFELIPCRRWEKCVRQCFFPVYALTFVHSEGHWEDNPESDRWWRYS